MSDDVASARRTIVDMCRSLISDGLVTGTSGNVSLRVDTDLVAISPGRTAYDSMTAEDVSLVDMEGNLLDGRPPSSETGLHVAIYRRTPHTSVVHTHSPYATAVGTVADALPAIHYAVHRLAPHEIPVVAYATFGSRELADLVATRIDTDTRAVLMRNHGVAAAGQSPGEALAAANSVEWLAELYWRASLLGTPHVLSAEDLCAVRDQVRRLNYTG